MGKPRLLVEAVSSYRGDREDRLTEMLAAALDAHDAFCRLFLTKAFVRASPASVSVHTQASLDGQVRLVDLVIRGFDNTPDPLFALFVENKYNPDRQANPYWFTDDQGRRQYAALKREPAPERHLIGVASRSDLWRDVPRQYARVLDWRLMEDIAHQAGGGPNWRIDARSPAAPAADRILLEFLTYLKGDFVGALEEDDLDVLARTVVVHERLVGLVERAAGMLDDSWTGDVAEDEWATPSDMPIFYATLEAPTGAWLHARRKGLFYLFASEAEWSDERSVGEPTLYAGAGWDARREERAVLAQSDWPKSAEAAGFQVLADGDGSYVVKSQPLREIVTTGGTRSEQAEHLALWARTAFDAVLKLSAPPDVGEATPKRKSKSRRLGTREAAIRREAG